MGNFSLDREMRVEIEIGRYVASYVVNFVYIFLVTVHGLKLEIGNLGEMKRVMSDRLIAD